MNNDIARTAAYHTTAPPLARGEFPGASPPGWPSGRMRALTAPAAPGWRTTVRYTLVRFSATMVPAGIGIFRPFLVAGNPAMRLY